MQNIHLCLEGDGEVNDWALDEQVPSTNLLHLKQFQWYLSLCSTILILANKLMNINDKAGRRYFEGSLKFQATLTSVLNMLTLRISLMAQQDIYGANVSQMWGIALLLFVMFLSPILIILAKNAISSIQLFAGKCYSHIKSE